MKIVVLIITMAVLLGCAGTKDVKSCEEWPEAASGACVDKPTPVVSCCTDYGNCENDGGAIGMRCSCKMKMPLGEVVKIPGKGCS